MKKKLPILIFLLFILVLFYFNRNSLFSKNYLGDLHLHTNCSGGKNSYEEMIQTATQKRLNFIAITEHEPCPEIIKKCKAENKILCIPGRELTGERIHLLALNTRGGIDLDLPLSKQVEEIHRQGGFAIAAHPNAEKYYYADSELKDSGIDAQECTSNSKERRFLPCVFDSDAHQTSDLAWQFNSCVGQIKTFEDLKIAILSNKCSRSVTLPLFSIRKTKVI